MDNTLEELKQDIAVTGYKITRYCDLLMLGKNEMADRFVLVLGDAFSTVIPKIINAYNEVDILKGEDSSIWTDQLKRVLEALGNDDDIRKIEVLKFEMVENMRMLLEVLEKSDE